MLAQRPRDVLGDVVLAPRPRRRLEMLIRRRRRPCRRATPLAGSALAAGTGLAGAELHHRDDRRAGDQREVGRTAVEAVELTGAAGALGEDADDSARRAAPAGTRLTAAGRG